MKKISTILLFVMVTVLVSGFTASAYDENDDYNGYGYYYEEPPDAREALLGVWDGTSENMWGYGRMQVLVFKYSHYYGYYNDYYYGYWDYFHAVIHLYDWSDGVHTSWLSSVNFEEGTGYFILSHIGDMSPRPDAGTPDDRRGTLYGDVFTGYVGGGRFSFETARVDSTAFPIDFAHEHIAGGLQEITVYATCSVEGVIVDTCIFCRMHMDAWPIPVDPYNHTPGRASEWIVTRAPTCVAEGEQIQRCNDCSAVLQTMSVPAVANHLFDEEYIFGFMYFTPILRVEFCSLCGMEGEVSVTWPYPWITPSILLGIVIFIIIVKKLINRGRGAGTTSHEQKADGFNGYVTISVVGLRGVGKSNYVGVLINELLENISKRFGFTVTGIDDTMDRYNETYHDSLYKKLTKLNPKNTGELKPLDFTITRKRKNYKLSVYDVDVENVDEFTKSHHISYSNGLIFLVDPLQIESVRKQLSKSILLTSDANKSKTGNTMLGDAVTKIARLIRNNFKMSLSKRIEIPTAVVLSKFDAVSELVPRDFKMLQKSPHSDAGKFIKSDSQKISSEAQELLSKWDAASVVYQAEVNYKKFSFFATSSFGNYNVIKSDNSIDRPNPHRIEDALLWILKNNKFI